MSEEKEVERKNGINKMVLALGSEIDQTMMELALAARFTKLRYDQFLKAGFTPEQAIQLCKL